MVYFHTVGIPSKDEKNVDYVPTVFWSGKTKSPMGKTVSILNQERVCCEDSNGSAINSQVDVNNAKGMIVSPCLATRCADTYYEHTGYPGDEELVVLDVEDDDERDEDIEVGSPVDEELHVVLDVEGDDERDEDIHVEAGCPGDELVGVEDEETGSDEDTETGIEAGCPDELQGVEDEETANHESNEDTERGIEASCLGDEVLKGLVVTCHCDNVVAVSAVQFRSCRQQHIMHLLRCLFFVEARFDFQLRCVHIPGYQNDCADDLSRNHLPSFFAKVTGAHPLPSPVPPTLLELLVSQELDFLSPRWSSLFEDTFRAA